MESKNGALLTKISAIINYVIAGIIAIAGLAIGAFGGISYNATIVLIGVAALSLIFGLLLHRAAGQMLDKKTVRKGAIWAIVLGAIMLMNITGILALIGGVIALLDSDKKK